MCLFVGIIFLSNFFDFVLLKRSIVANENPYFGHAEASRAIKLLTTWAFSFDFFNQFQED